MRHQCFPHAASATSPAKVWFASASLHPPLGVIWINSLPTLVYILARRRHARHWVDLERRLHPSAPRTQNVVDEPTFLGCSIRLFQANPAPRCHGITQHLFSVAQRHLYKQPDICFLLIRNIGHIETIDRRYQLSFLQSDLLKMAIDFSRGNSAVVFLLKAMANAVIAPCLPPARSRPGCMRIVLLEDPCISFPRLAVHEPGMKGFRHSSSRAPQSTMMLTA